MKDATFTMERPENLQEHVPPPGVTVPPPGVQIDDSRLLSAERETRIIQNTEAMLRSITPTPLFWATLSKYEVITVEEINEIQRSGNATPHNQIYDLLDHVVKRTNRRYVGLLKALAETGHEHIVTKLLKENLPEMSERSSSEICVPCLLSEGKIELLRKKQAKLVELVRLSPSFWAHLRKNDVVLASDIDYIQKGGASDHAQVAALVTHLMTQTDEKYKGFLDALTNTGQEHIVIQILGEDVPSSELSTGQKDLPAEKRWMLKDKLPALKEQVQTSDALWDILMKNHVLSQFEVEDFKDRGNSTNEQQVQGLIEYLIEGTNATYRGFLYALSEVGQRHVVTEVLRENVPDLTPAAGQEQGHAYSVLLKEGKKKLLKEKAPELIDSIKLTNSLWTLLSTYGTITETDAKNMETGSENDASKVSHILEILQKGTMKHYHSFIQSLIESDQLTVVTDILGEDVSVYKVNNTGPVISNRKLNEAVTNLRAEYLRNIFSSNLYDDIDLKDVYTSLILGEISKDGKRPISENEVLQETSDGQVLTLCIGDAGTGKSTLAQRIAWLWAKGQQDSLHFWSKIKAVLIIQPTDEGETLQQTLRNAIPGKIIHKDMILELIDVEPENILLIVEAFDQFQNANVIRDIKQMIKNRATNVFMTARKNHPCLTQAFQSYFTQCIEVDGFTQADSVQYVKKVLAHTTCDIEKFLKSIKGKPLFDNNPLNLTLACLLFSSGELDHCHLETLTEVELYSMRESRMVERELELRQQCDVDELPERKTEELHKIHALAIYMFLEHKTRCKRSDLDSLNIDPKSPMMVLLEQHRTSNVKYGKDNFWVWPHSRLHEFDAAMALVGIEPFVDSLWPLWVASRSDLNSVAQLAAAKLGIDGRYDDVATLTTATMLLQCKAECTAAEEVRHDLSHACSWVTEVKESLSQTMNTGKVFQGHRCKSIQTSQKGPDLEKICECKSSLLNGNVNIFEHVQTCWKLGALNIERKEYISRTESSLLPAIDKCEGETLYLMLPDITAWKDAWELSVYHRPTVLDIHFGIGSSVDKEQLVLRTDEWTGYVKELLENVKPEVLHIHHAHTCQPSDELISLVNEKQYLIDIRDSTWIIWASGDNVRHTQEYIKETGRFIFISRTQDDEMTINVEQLQDTLYIKPNVEDLKRREFVFNVGFPTARSHCPCQLEETATEWQQVISNLLDVWHPENNMLIRSANTQILDCILDYKFQQLLRTDKGYDMVHDSADKGIRFHNMIPTHPDAAGKQTYVYNTFDDRTNIRVQHPADIVDIKAGDIGIDVTETMTLFLSDGGNSSSISDLAADFGRCIKHLLDEFGVQLVVLQDDYTATDGNALLNMIYENGMVWDDNFGMKIYKRQLRISRVRNLMKQSPDTSQPVQIQHTDYGEVTLTVGQLSDCMVLQKDDIKMNLKTLIVEIEPERYPKRQDDDSINALELAKEEEDSLANHAWYTRGHTEGWQPTFNHLLETFHPAEVRINVPRTESGIKEDRFHMSLQDGSLYWCRWTGGGTTLHITRKENVDTVVVPDTSRCISIYQDDDEMNIVTERLKDCMVLEKPHIKHPGDHVLNVHVNCLRKQDAATTTSDNANEGWQQVFQHLLETFHPPSLDIRGLNTNSGIQDGTFHILLDDGTVYYCSWDADKTWFIIERYDNVQAVAVPNTSRCVRIYQRDEGFFRILPTRLSDCMVLLREHIQGPYDVLCLHLNLVSLYDVGAKYKQDGRLQDAVQHLLDTFHPPDLRIAQPQAESEMQEDFCMVSTDNMLYKGRWYDDDDDDDDALVIERKEAFQLLKGPDTSRCVGIMQGDDGTVSVVANHLSDCMTLHTEHIQTTDGLTLRVDLSLILSQPEAARLDTAAEWQRTIHHLLDTFHPALLIIHRAETQTLKTFGRKMKDDSVYEGNWNDDNTTFVIVRQEQVVPKVSKFTSFLRSFKSK